MSQKEAAGENNAIYKNSTYMFWRDYWNAKNSNGLKIAVNGHVQIVSWTMIK